MTTLGELYGCYDATNCESGLLVEAFLGRDEEVGAHAATVRSTTGSWSVTGTLTITTFDLPSNGRGHLSGSIAVDSSVTIDGTFDHDFCLDIVSFLL